MTWTPERRLRIVAVMLAAKRLETMGRNRAPAFNHESMLAIAAAPDRVLDEQANYLARLEQSFTPEQLWSQVESDIRRMFPRPAWPAWLEELPVS